MLKVNYFELGWQNALLRFFLLMFLVILGVFTKIWFIAFLALPVFLSIMLGVAFKFESAQKAGKVVLINKEQKVNRKAG